MPLRLATFLLLSLGLSACDPQLNDDDDFVDDDDSVGDDDDDVTACLLLGAFVVDDNGDELGTFPPDATIHLVGSLTNNCFQDITFTTSTGCLFEPWTLTGAAGSGLALGCDDAETVWVVEATGVLLDEEVLSGILVADEYLWEIGFIDGQEASYSFVVAE